MIRVLHVLGGLNRGGDETMVMNLYRKIDRTQIQFDFIIHTKEHQAYYDEIISLGGKIYSFPAFNGKNFFTLKKLWNNIFKEHREYKILHSHIRSYASLYLPIAKKYGVKTIIHSHNTSNGKGLSAVAKNILQFPLRYQADYLFACSQQAGEWLFGKKACKRDNFQIIPNAIDVERYKFNEETRKKYRKELKIDDKYVLGHVGRFTEQKNHMFLLEIFNEFLKINSQSVLLLIGDGELRPQIENRIKELNIKDKVILLGSRDDVPELMQAMDIFVFPSCYEGFGIVVIEAQFAGLQCICSINIPEEAIVTKSCKKLPFIRELWIKTLCEKNMTDRKKSIIDDKYDINKSTKEITRFYEEINDA